MTTITGSKLLEIAGAVAALLGEEWQVTAPNGWCATLLRPGGAGLSVNTQSHRGRLTWGEVFPAGPRGQDFGPAYRDRMTITTSTEKPPEKIVADLRRLLLPAFEVHLTQTLERKIKAEATDRADTALAKEVGDVLGITPRKNAETYAFFLYENILKHVYGTISITNGVVKVDIDNIPPDLLRIIARAIAAHQRA